MCIYCLTAKIPHIHIIYSAVALLNLNQLNNSYTNWLSQLKNSTKVLCTSCYSTAPTYCVIYCGVTAYDFCPMHVEYISRWTHYVTRTTRPVSQRKEVVVWGQSSQGYVFFYILYKRTEKKKCFLFFFLARESVYDTKGNFSLSNMEYQFIS